MSYTHPSIHLQSVYRAQSTEYSVNGSGIDRLVSLAFAFDFNERRIVVSSSRGLTVSQMIISPNGRVHLSSV